MSATVVRVGSDRRRPLVAVACVLHMSYRALSGSIWMCWHGSIAGAARVILVPRHAVRVRPVMYERVVRFGRSGAKWVRINRKIVLPLGKYGIGVLPGIPESIGNILEDGQSPSPASIEIWVLVAPNFRGTQLL